MNDGNELHAPQSVHASEFVRAVNFGHRRGPRFEAVGRPDLIVLHYTGMGSAATAFEWLIGEASGVSCHYFVHEDGRIVQLVDEKLRAHHAGAGRWHGDDDVNSRSIGVEIVNRGHTEDPATNLPAYPHAQMRMVSELCLDIMARHEIAPWAVVAHSDTAPGRKRDPGEHFDWEALARSGAAACVEAHPVRAGTFFQEGDSGEPVQALQAMLAAAGYELPVTGLFDRRTRAVVEAFQRRHRRERVDGVADPSTVVTLADWLRSLPSEALSMPAV